MLAKGLAAGAVFAVVLGGVSSVSVAAQTREVVEALQRGGHVVVMRHARSPGQPPDARTANPDNTEGERQLDEAGRIGAQQMGAALRALSIPVGQVWSSPTYRARETVRLLGFEKPSLADDLGDGGRSMKGASRSQARALRQRVEQLPSGANTLIVTHEPNILGAFPEVGRVAEGEALVFGPDGSGGVRLVGRITIDEWPRLASDRGSPQPHTQRLR